MADVFITLKIMPAAVDTDLKPIESKAVDEIKAYGATVTKVEIEPIAFGLSSLNITILMDESKGATDPLEEKLLEIDGVAGVSVIDVRRAIG